MLSSRRHAILYARMYVCTYMCICTYVLPAYVNTEKHAYISFIVVRYIFPIETCVNTCIICAHMHMYICMYVHANACAYFFNMSM